MARPDFPVDAPSALLTPTGPAVAEWRAEPRGRAWLGSPRIEALAARAVIVAFVVFHAMWLIRVPGDLDSYNFVLGVRHFDVRQHRPHPPGAPVYVGVGKVARWLWTGLGLPADRLTGSTPAALAALSVIAGTLCLVLLSRIVAELDGPPRHERAVLLLGAAPLLWIEASRPMSDVMGLLLVLSVYLCLQRGRTAFAWLLAGLAVGVRVQTALLTVPALAACLMAHVGSPRELFIRVRTRTCGGRPWWWVGGVAAWLVPLLVVSGGPFAYWAAIRAQANDDLLNPTVLAVAPTARNVADALTNTFVRPWGPPALAALMLTAALVGIVRGLRSSPRRTEAVLIACVPYLLFHVMYQETSTIRYALPTVLAVAYFASGSADGLPRHWQRIVVSLLVVANLFVSVRTLYAYQHRSAPGMSLLAAMYSRAAVDRPAFVTGHANLKLQRLHEVLTLPVPWTLVSRPAPYEWQSLVDHWRSGRTTPVWFVADPRRTDLALMDGQSQRVLGTFGLDARAQWALRGMRPRAFVWRELSQPAWIAVQGFALTPEIGGLAAGDRHGPAFDGAVALARRLPGGAILVVGGRHVGSATDPPARVTVAIDDRIVSSAMVSPQQRSYVMMTRLGPEQLQGEGPYATVRIVSTPSTPSARPIPVTVEQFDFQPPDRPLFAWLSGWYEPELQTDTGRTWRWASRRATMWVHRPCGTALEVAVRGELSPPRLRQLPQISISRAGQVVDTFRTWTTFTRRITLPDERTGDTCDVNLTLDSATWMVPAEEGSSADQRELAFRLFDVSLTRSPSR